MLQLLDSMLHLLQIKRHLGRFKHRVAFDAPFEGFSAGCVKLRVTLPRIRGRGTRGRRQPMPKYPTRRADQDALRHRASTLVGQQTKAQSERQETTTDTKITLIGLASRVEYDFLGAGEIRRHALRETKLGRVLAPNSTGDAPPSNMVTVVL
ncbi:MAG: hypothetical protein DCC46_11655 [Armatimonadetes bacterium]|nr:MAG: hypothetical protein DCC46_11655 [Armatimonadota bacterium]